MLNTREFSEAQAHEFRQGFYNAELVGFNLIHEDLAILRVRPDGEPLHFAPGQYTVLGLGFWEPRIAATQDESLDAIQLDSLAKRAYSISCPLIASDGQLVPAASAEALEFYVSLIRYAEQHPPALTPRLFALAVGDRLFLSRQIRGHYTLDRIHPDNDVVFVATGTGEAPHNAMLAELLASGHRGRIVSVVCVRYHRDLTRTQT